MKKQAITMFIVILISGFTLNAQVSITPIITETTCPGSYKILKKNKSPIKIPFKMVRGKPVMKLKINGKKANLMIDNGVLWEEVWLFGTPLVDKLKLTPFEEGEIGGSGEGDPTPAYYSSTNLTLKFKDIIFYEQPAIVSPLAAGFTKMFPGVDGQLCNTFFKHFIVEFDFTENEIILHNPKQFKYEGNGSVLDMSLNESGTYAVPFCLTMPNGDVFNDMVDIDFGGIYPLKIALNNKNKIELPSEVKETLSYGAQGKNSEYVGKIKSFTIGEYKFENPNVVFGEETTSRIEAENLGVIGLPLFMKFNIIFDYFNNKLYITPNENFNTSFE